MTFRIDWSIDTDEYELARATARVIRTAFLFDDEFCSRSYVLWGQLQLTSNDEQLFPPSLILALMQHRHDKRRTLLHPRYHRSPYLVPLPNVADIKGIDVSLAEFAFKLAKAVFHGFDREHRSGPAIIELLDPEVSIILENDGDHIRIFSTLLSRPALIIQRQQLIEGAYQFLDEILDCVRRHAPELMYWNAFADVRQVMSQRGRNI